MQTFPWNQTYSQVDTVAAVDCGTNSIRLLVLRRDNGVVQELCREMRIVRLGQGVEQSKLLAPEAIARTVEAAIEYAQVCVGFGVQRLRFVATSATRDALNRAEFISAIESVIGVVPEVLSGEVEAKYSFTGAVTALSDLAWPALVVDIGGGSTEFVLGDSTASGQVQVVSAFSADMGSVRLTEKFSGLADELQVRLEAQRAARWVDKYLDSVSSRVDFRQVRSLVGVAGTVTTVTAKALGLKKYQPERIHGARLSYATQVAACEFMINAGLAEKAALPYMPVGRADVIAAGAIIWERVMARVHLEAPAVSVVSVSEKDILDGVALGLL
ncbi:Ppx/GppA phosphatase family protein [Gleimia coleocanis DSM 15436]|uniref:Ppx/GppA phosphatase family protein n=1 Tax=Gleimia coleocanis DSM 15436 TaxID=525245 RepID=C0VZM3_9ACTO|nr:Ppx/GppA phosphatase family protein [Gleimia coleocanis]EEH64142.1 Ppx/GppA phosphatase family protein [Gleimia coleocanis DSM 15436]